jgi:hypothetical protein
METRLEANGYRSTSSKLEQPAFVAALARLDFEKSHLAIPIHYQATVQDSLAAH